MSSGPYLAHEGGDAHGLGNFNAIEQALDLRNAGSAGDGIHDWPTWRETLDVAAGNVHSAIRTGHGGASKGSIDTGESKQYRACSTERYFPGLFVSCATATQGVTQVSMRNNTQHLAPMTFDTALNFT